MSSVDAYFSRIENALSRVRTALEYRTENGCISQEEADHLVARIRRQRNVNGKLSEQNNALGTELSQLKETLVADRAEMDRLIHELNSVLEGNDDADS